MILEHLDKNNLHHAYLIEGAREEVVPQILEFLKGTGVAVVGNPDFCHISADYFKIEDARNLKSFGVEKSFSAGKKIFLISTNNFLLEAQQALLKMFEEPIENTHFFLTVPDVNALLQTFVSRFYVVSTRSCLAEEVKNAENFLVMSLKNRIDFLKELLLEEELEDEEGNEIVSQNSTRSKALKFLNALESVLHERMSKAGFDTEAHFFDQIFKTREFLRQPGSSAKSLMESVALTVPKF